MKVNRSTPPERSYMTENGKMPCKYCYAPIHPSAQVCPTCGGAFKWMAAKRLLIGALTAVILPAVATGIAWFQAIQAAAEANKAQEAMTSASNAVTKAEIALSKVEDAAEQAEGARRNANGAAANASNAVMFAGTALTLATNAAQVADNASLSARRSADETVGVISFASNILSGARMTAASLATTQQGLVHFMGASAWEVRHFDEVGKTSDEALKEAVAARLAEMEDFAAMQIALVLHDESIGLDYPSSTEVSPWANLGSSNVTARSHAILSALHTHLYDRAFATGAPRHHLLTIALLGNLSQIARNDRKIMPRILAYRTAMVVWNREQRGNGSSIPLYRDEMRRRDMLDRLDSYIAKEAGHLNETGAVPH